MVLFANDDFNKRELSIGELETAAGGGFDLGGLIGGVVGGGLHLPISSNPHPHHHHPLPSLNDVLKDIPPITGGLFGFL
jgi:hypothetical protein